MNNLNQTDLKSTELNLSFILKGQTGSPFMVRFCLTVLEEIPAGILRLRSIQDRTHRGEGAGQQQCSGSVCRTYLSLRPGWNLPDRLVHPPWVHSLRLKPKRGGSPELFNRKETKQGAGILTTTADRLPSANLRLISCMLSVVKRRSLA
ncbi:hypothetical protein ILYODFUR_023727 [Ilyodon furcidens]|uniref:Uncharacterized protein n=1 Tax=Ilyodon furcidens TaxID=33524 RepID=A0ABV0TL49_9TELE